MIKKLIICPSCEALGKKEVLGEIDSSGNFSVMRFHKGTTIVQGKRMEVICGVCKEVVYVKNVK